MSSSLLVVPPEILSLITSQLHFMEIYRLYLTGNRLLHSRLAQGGVQKIKFFSVCASMLWDRSANLIPRFPSYFPSLLTWKQTISTEFTHGKLLDLRNLPRSLTELTLRVVAVSGALLPSISDKEPLFPELRILRLTSVLPATAVVEMLFPLSNQLVWLKLPKLPLELVKTLPNTLETLDTKLSPVKQHWQNDPGFPKNLAKLSIEDWNSYDMFRYLPTESLTSLRLKSPNLLLVDRSVHLLGQFLNRAKKLEKLDLAFVCGVAHVEALIEGLPSTPLQKLWFTPPRDADGLLSALIKSFPASLLHWGPAEIGISDCTLDVTHLYPEIVKSAPKFELYPKQEDISHSTDPLQTLLQLSPSATTLFVALSRELFPFLPSTLKSLILTRSSKVYEDDYPLDYPPSKPPGTFEVEDKEIIYPAGLTELTLSEHGPKKRFFEHLKQSRLFSLSKLTMVSCDMPPSYLPPSLTYLCFADPVEDLELHQPLPAVEKLRSLELYCSWLAPAFLCSLPSTLTLVNFRACPFPAEFLPHLKHLIVLKSLDVKGITGVFTDDHAALLPRSVTSLSLRGHIRVEYGALRLSLAGWKKLPPLLESLTMDLDELDYLMVFGPTTVNHPITTFLPYLRYCRLGPLGTSKE